MVTPPYQPDLYFDNRVTKTLLIIDNGAPFSHNILMIKKEFSGPVSRQQVLLHSGAFRCFRRSIGMV
jgi:hypothetical protein